MFQDKTIECAFIGCGEVFIHSVKDQEFYADTTKHKDIFQDPKYCKFHREQRKANKLKKEQESNIIFNPVLDKISGHEFIEKIDLDTPNN